MSSRRVIKCHPIPHNSGAQVTNIKSGFREVDSVGKAICLKQERRVEALHTENKCQAEGYSNVILEKKE